MLYRRAINVGNFHDRRERDVAREQESKRGRQEERGERRYCVHAAARGDAEDALESSINVIGGQLFGDRVYIYSRSGSSKIREN